MDTLYKKIEKTSTCWNWKGEIKEGKGYGRFDVNGRKYAAHRYVYELLVGKIPKGLEIDHLCRNRLCVNPKHLEPVTHLENIRRALPFKKIASHCKYGHEFSGKNLCIRVSKRGVKWRVCRKCRNNAFLNYYHTVLKKKK